MKIQYSSPLLEVVKNISGNPLCGSTGESFDNGGQFPGIDDWSKN